MNGARRRLWAAFAALCILAACGGGGGSGGAVAPSGGATPHAKTPNSVDWTTFGFDRQRTSANPAETAISPATVAGLHRVWSFALGGTYTNTQPVVATNVVRADGSYADAVYAGDERGNMFAVDASNGALLWSRALGTVTSPCTDIPDGVFGITATPAIDRARNRIYVIDGRAMLWAFDLGTGANAPGWPAAGVAVYGGPTTNHTYSGLLLAPDASSVYVASASYCDAGLYFGTLSSVTAAGAVSTRSLMPALTPGYGNGVWSWGGASIDPDNGNLFVGVGNGFPESAPWSDSVLELTASLQFVADVVPDAIAGGDVDFGATPIAYDDGGRCTALGRKDGAFFAFDRTNLGAGPTARLTNAGPLVTPAYGAATHMLYLAPRGSVVALTTGPGCTLTPAWSASAATPGLSVPSVAGGVVFVAAGNAIAAFDARTGAPLWSSGAAIGGPVMAEPTVANGRVYATSWDGRLTAFALP